MDRNKIAVELARLGVWIHTFVPGLPLSFLDHNLVHGDSLTGVGALAEADTAISEKYPSTGLFSGRAAELLDKGKSALRRLERISDATISEIASAREAHHEALVAAADARALFDLISAGRAGVQSWPDEAHLDRERLVEAAERTEVAEAMTELQPVHFPWAFPEVFLRERPGFDCLLGNPPWEKVKVEEHGFWALRFPGLKSMAQGKRDREIARLSSERPDLVAEHAQEREMAERLRSLLHNGPFPGMGTGDPDLYKAFCWRFWHLARTGGRIGIVLPRVALAAKGNEKWRKVVLDEGAFNDVTTLVNNAGWVFDDVHPQYTIGLCSMRKGPGLEQISISGPFADRDAYDRRTSSAPIAISEFKTWTRTAALPLLPSAESLAVFRKLRAHPRLRGQMTEAEQGTSPPNRTWATRPVRELDATNDKHLFILDDGAAASAGRPGIWPVYTGKSFNLWNPDTGSYYASADTEQITAHLQNKRRNQHLNATSAFSELGRETIDDHGTLPCLKPRIAFRDVARATDNRTVIAALVPGETVIVHKAPYLLWPSGTARDQAYLLGMLSSMVLDWYARRFVEINLSFYIFDSLPIPDPGEGHPVRDRVTEIAGRLAAVDMRFSEWAAQAGVPVGTANDEAAKQELVFELDACVAHLYGLDEADIAVVYDTFHKNADYSDRKHAVLDRFRRLQHN